MAEIDGVLIKIRRAFEQVAYVKVPLSEEVVEAIRQGEKDYIAVTACSIGGHLSTKWIQESSEIIEVHPIQTPAPANYR